MPSIAQESLKTVPLSYATVSVGTPTTPLPKKLDAISSAGFTGIEMGFPDLLSFASSFHSKSIPEDDYESLSSTASEIQKLCKEKSLKIMMLQPFSNFEGWPAGSSERKEAFERAKGWIKIMHALGTDMLQVGSTDTPASKLDLSRERIVKDLQELADLLAKNKFRMAYENWCWSTHAPAWKDVWEIVKEVDRDNDELRQKYTTSLKNLTSEIPPEKIYLLQLSDAYIPPSPLDPDQPDGSPASGKELRARGRWSHDYRPYIHGKGAYTRECVEMCKAVLATGNRAWFSLEVFDGGKEGKGGSGTGMSEDEGEMKEFCKGAMEGTKWVLGECVDK
ncbi:putative 3-dehydroshikimate dehydratase [Glarea lozoyensis 74030]|uniref:Putative 3-dehydroshikimate dehydratase n=1 Tax=Glarea lozoyensis (strain ATCC 74030 / MF5533) TaxID=1104152 RepID=H0EHK7_GLAL7|nr:putative 3-dehydroshikimate dehydratase [Glarea lozoyensis 74030]